MQRANDKTGYSLGAVWMGCGFGYLLGAITVGLFVIFLTHITWH